jgi:serine/threonine protein phosphatase PrpC
MDDLLRTKECQTEIKSLGECDEESYAGCTANVILLTPTEIYCANCGDSRSIL